MCGRRLVKYSNVEHHDFAVNEFEKGFGKLSDKLARLQREYFLGFGGLIIPLHVDIVLNIWLSLLVVCVALCCLALVPVNIATPFIRLSVLGCNSVFFYKNQGPRRLKRQCLEELGAFGVETSTLFR